MPILNRKKKGCDNKKMGDTFMVLEPERTEKTIEIIEDGIKRKSTRYELCTICRSGCCHLLGAYGTYNEFGSFKGICLECLSKLNKLKKENNLKS